MPSPKDKSLNIIPFVIEFNPSIPNIGFIVNRYNWGLLHLSNNSAVTELHKYKAVMAYKRLRNLKDILVKSKFSETSELKFSSSECKRPTRCTHRSRIVKSDHFLSSVNCTSFKLNWIQTAVQEMLFSSFHVKSVTSSTLGKRVNRCRKELTVINSTSVISKTLIPQLMLLHTSILMVIV